MVPVLFLYLWARFRSPHRADFTERRRTLQYGAILVFSTTTYRATETVGALRGMGRRFTRLRSLPPGEGSDAFPVTSWAAGGPDPVNLDSWSLPVTGLVNRSLGLDRADFTPGETRSVLLDCTSGWYIEQHRTSVRLDDTLDAAGVHSSARWVAIRSVMGSRWSFSIAEAREMLLATRVGGDPLSHSHGVPL